MRPTPGRRRRDRDHPQGGAAFRKRLAVVAGIDLDDPEAGFEAMLQLRLHPPRY
ncbi:MULTISPECIES: hypothetical protein [unclassified Streptomyces]|uniref:hypothetical protein n=1 Tax=unclassified Streptomyces TaxID=2593676 RepID=UPI00225AC429|nr:MULTISPECIES: hypothetical protein [unclassified Streptomyces]WSP59458.1 hypothetical protein OG306_37575 [Streptomyces sp. NBC_01241]WSU20023.1 hypothetical protein OG508_02790 [Streptomyces sp. NBC_01108]MCX4791228.1 hypothetical protein [Streptomyces sp. NBC_01221]MCX4793056.1 hypothetical protein [Streptomyces sp. NBC_01242]WSP60951.1 hypothetical protein OG466_02875 [Streptomyces sp. NBC_01240]